MTFKLLKEIQYANTFNITLLFNFDCNKPFDWLKKLDNSV